MNFLRTTSLWVVMAVLGIGIASSAHATTIWSPCTAGRWSPNGATDRIIVNVYLDPTLSSYLGVSQLDLESAVTEAAAIWNEQSGAAIALRWSGAPPAGVNVPSLKSIYVWHSPTNACGSGTLMASYGTISNGINQERTIEVRKYANLSNGNCIDPIAWLFNAETGSGFDFVSKLVHEFGHTLFDRNEHPGTSPCPSTDPMLTETNHQQSVMDADGVDLAGRSLRAWDQHRVANLYSHRQQYSSLNYKIWNNSTGLWSGNQVAVAAPSRINHRVSTSQNASSILFEWVERGPVATNNNRGPLKARWFGSFFANSYEPLIAGAGRVEAPGAIAVDTVNNRAIVVYQRHVAAQYALNGDVLHILYRLSTNGGISFGPELEVKSQILCN